MAKKTFVGSTAEALRNGLYAAYGTGEFVASAGTDLIDEGFNFSQGIADALSGVPMSRLGDKLWLCGVTALKKLKDVTRRIIDGVVQNLK